MTNRAIAHARLRNSRLVGPPLGTPQDVVRWSGAVQSQDVPGALWAIGQRLPHGASAEVVGGAFDRGEIVRTHAMRPTWHFLAPDELRWIQALTGERVHRVAGSMYRRLGLDDAVFRRAEAAMRGALSGGRARTRDELRDPVRATGLDLADPLVITHLAMHAELDCVICSGPRHGKQFTYQLVDERVPSTAPRERDDALRDLALRYFTSHGPALVHDMAWWSGLTVTDVRRGVELAGDALERRDIDGRPYVAARGGFEPGDIPEPHVLLLSNYDEYLGSYTDYSPIFDTSLPQARSVSDVLGVHIVVRAGLVVGGWRRAFRGRRAVATVTLLDRLSAAERQSLERETERWAVFFGLQPELDVREA
ncbi:MAG TPA: winged helix DNA-binding domain-containing protein [Candidatus Limnocylindrales bacterium]|nr:winged helix DNA-binding domain-containing protein [Candidatus Limnocylindrales bacterium]